MCNDVNYVTTFHYFLRIFQEIRNSKIPTKDNLNLWIVVIILFPELQNDLRMDQLKKQVFTYFKLKFSYVILLYIALLFVLCWKTKHCEIENHLLDFSVYFYFILFRLLVEKGLPKILSFICLTAHSQVWDNFWPLKAL